MHNLLEEHLVLAHVVDQREPVLEVLPDVVAFVRHALMLLHFYQILDFCVKLFRRLGPLTHVDAPQEAILVESFRRHLEELLSLVVVDGFVVSQLHVELSRGRGRGVQMMQSSFGHDVEQLVQARLQQFGSCLKEVVNRDVVFAIGQLKLERLQLQVGFQFVGSESREVGCEVHRRALVNVLLTLCHVGFQFCGKGG